jgi:hypothetical protein
MQGFFVFHADEENELSMLERDISLNDEKINNILAKELQYYPLEKLFKFSEKSPSFRRFCEIESLHTEEWSRVIKKQGGIGKLIISLDKSESCTIFDEYLGFFLLYCYETFKIIDHQKALFCLDKACDFGFFHALIERCKLYQEQIKNSLHSLPEETINKLNHDLHRLGNLYWKIGYIHSAMVLLDIGNCLDNTFEEPLEKRAHLFHEAAAENFFSARLLANPNLTSSTELFNAICKEEGLGVFGFKTWDEAGNGILELLDKDTRDSIFVTVKNRIKSYTYSK